MNTLVLLVFYIVVVCLYFFSILKFNKNISDTIYFGVRLHCPVRFTIHGCVLILCSIQVEIQDPEWYAPPMSLYIAVFLPAVNTSSQPVNLSGTMSGVVFTTSELGASRNFPICDIHL